MLKILVVEGNVKESRSEATAAGLPIQSDLYEKTLLSLDGDLGCTTVFPADADAKLPQSADLGHFDGIAWTGSALNLYKGGPAVERQIDFMKLCLGRGARIFGSCWGMQVASVAAGGEVAANPQGREIGIAREIRITRQGQSHPMYRGKPPVFDAVAIHLDHVVRLPPETAVLSYNGVSEVQAIEIRYADSIFWGVQYHPEFDLDYISGLIRRYGSKLVAEGVCEDETEVAKWADDLAAAHRGKGGEELRKSYRIGNDVLDPRRRLLELSNWLAYLRREKRARGDRAPTADRND